MKTRLYKFVHLYFKEALLGQTPFNFMNFVKTPLSSKKFHQPKCKSECKPVGRISLIFFFFKIFKLDRDFEPSTLFELDAFVIIAVLRWVELRFPRIQDMLLHYQLNWLIKLVLSFFFLEFFSSRGRVRFKKQEGKREISIQYL